MEPEEDTEIEPQSRVAGMTRLRIVSSGSGPFWSTRTFGQSRSWTRCCGFAGSCIDSVARPCKEMLPSSLATSSTVFRCSNHDQANQDKRCQGREYSVDFETGRARRSAACCQGAGGRARDVDTNQHVAASAAGVTSSAVLRTQITWWPTG